MTKRWCPLGLVFNCACDSGADDVSHGDREIERLNTWAVTHELMMVLSRPIRAPDRRVRLRGGPPFSARQRLWVVDVRLPDGEQGHSTLPGCFSRR